VEPDGRVGREARYDSTAYPTFEDVLVEFLALLPGSVDAACFGVAGPVMNNRAEVTNVGWKISAEAIRQAFGIGEVTLVNDFYAIALGVPLLEERDLLSIHAGQRDRTAPMGILGAGTGLGEAIVIYSAGRHHVIPGEGGHRDFAPQDEEQTRLLLQLQERYGHVSWERVVSGMGLVNIFTFLGGPELGAAEIAELAEADDPLARRTFEIFVDTYGAEAGNLGLTILARGGIYLAGGIAAKNTSWFTDGRFVEAFLRKGRFRRLMESIPVDLIMNEEVGLIGAVEGARRSMLESPVAS
jgi:glucokinase